MRETERGRGKGEEEARYRGREEEEEVYIEGRGGHKEEGEGGKETNGECKVQRVRVRRRGTYREGRGRIEAMRERKSEKEDREKE